MSNDLRIGVVFDGSNLESGMNAAAASVEQLGTRIQIASKNMAQAQREFGQAAAQGSKQAKEAIAQYASELEAAQAAQNAFAVSANTTAEAVTRVGASARQAATAGIGILEGRMMSGNRAAAAFLSTTLGLGPVLQAAFPVVGALAMGEVLFDIAERIGKFATNAQELANETGAGWLTGAIGQFDGLKEAVAQTDAEMLQLAQDMDSLKREGQGLNFEQIRMTQGPAAGYRAEGDAAGAESARQSVFLDRIKQQRDSLQKQIDQAQGTGKFSGQGVDVYSSLNASSSAMIKAKGDLEVFNDQIRTYTANIDNLNKKQQNLYLQGDQAQTKEDKPLHGKSAEQEALLADRAAFAELQQHRALTLKEEFDFWNTRVENYQRGSQEYLDVLDRANQLAHQGAEQAHRTIEEARRRARGGADDDTSVDLMPGMLKAEKGEADKDDDKRQEAAIKAAQERYERTQRSVRFNQAAGNISGSRGTKQLLAATDSEESYTVGALKQEQSHYNPKGDQEQVDKFNELQTKITAKQAEFAAQRERIVQQEALKEQQAYAKSLNLVGNELNTVVDKWLTGTGKMSRAWTEMGDHIALSAINALLKIAEHEAQHEVTSMAIHAAANQSKVANDAITHAESTEIVKAEGLKQALVDAKNSAVSGWKAGMALPFPENVIMAPVLAGVGLAGALAQFEQGTDYVPSTGLAMIHEGEAVATRGENSQISKLIGMAGGGSRQNGQVHIHNNANFSGIDGASVAGMYRKHSQSANREMMRTLRTQGLVQG